MFQREDAGTATVHAAQDVMWFESVGWNDVPRVGRKNASLGEMIRGLEAAGVRVPPGFATTADAHRLRVELSIRRRVMFDPSRRCSVEFI